MQKDEFIIGYTHRYIVLPKTFAVWDTQTNCWVAQSDNTEKSIVHEMADKFNEMKNKINLSESLEQTASLYGEKNGEIGTTEPLATAFESGAKWQKEQYKYLFILAARAAQELDLLGPIELADSINAELAKLLQDEK